MDLERAFISKVLMERSLNHVLEENVPTSLFVEHVGVWEWILQEYQEHGDLPPVDLVEQKWPQFEIYQVEGSVLLLLEELRSRRVRNLIVESMQRQADLLKAKEPLKALEEVRELLLVADVETRAARDVNIVEHPELRVKQYEEVVVAGGITGLPSPWPCLDEVTMGFNPEDLVMFVGRGGVGKCLDSQSRIVDPCSGVERTLEEVIEGDQASIWSWSQEEGIHLAPIEAKVDTGFKRCFTFKSESGREVTVTPEHPFLTPEGWVRADCLDEGDYIALPARIPDPIQEVGLPAFEVDLLAVLLSEGSYSGNHVGFTTEDAEFRRVAEVAAACVGAKVQAVVGSEIDYDFVLSGKSAGRHTPNPVRELLKRLGIDRKKAKEKWIPDEVFALPKKQLARFLGVFWMGDGYIERGAPSVTLASEEMVRQIQHLLLRFGIQSSVRYKPVKGGFHAWRLRVYSQYQERFFEEIPLWGGKEAALEGAVLRRREVKANPNVGGPRWRTDREWEKTEVFWDRVESVEDAGVRKIYDLTVAHSHCFVANDVIVHNTWAETVLATHHWSLGHPPLLFSREMAVWQIVRRVDAINARLPYKRFRAGQLTSFEYERWKQALADMRGGVPFWVSGDNDGAVGVTGITAKVKKYRPAAVYIDGAYLIGDDRGGDAGWERFSNVCQDLKRLAQRERLPVVVTHQFNLAGKGDKGDADTLAYGDVQKWFDLVIGMYQTEDLRLNKEMMFKILKQREGEKLEWVASWDLEKMVFNVKASGVDDVGPSTEVADTSHQVRY